jgi:hypothetical protein
MGWNLYFQQTEAGTDSDCGHPSRALCCLLRDITLSLLRESPDCPSLRASDEHSFIVRVPLGIYSLSKRGGHAASGCARPTSTF